MTIRHTLSVAALAVVALASAACTPAANDADAARDTDTTTIIEREVPAAPIVVEREVAVPTPPVVIETDRQDDSTTVRAGRDGIEVETTNR
jgi:AMMECR1 domain-containing protein